VMAPAGVEISHAAGRGDRRQVVRLTAVVVQLSLIAFLCVALLLEGLGPVIFDWWTRQRIDFQHGLMGLYLAMSAANMPGRVAAQVLISVNAMRLVAIAALVIALVSTALGTVLIGSLGLPAVLIAGIAGEVAISIVLLSFLSRWLALPIFGLAREVTHIEDSAAFVWARARAFLRRQGS